MLNIIVGTVAVLAVVRVQLVIVIVIQMMNFQTCRFVDCYTDVELFFRVARVTFDG